MYPPLKYGIIRLLKTQERPHLRVTENMRPFHRRAGISPVILIIWTVQNIAEKYLKSTGTAPNKQKYSRRQSIDTYHLEHLKRNKEFESKTPSKEILNNRNLNIHCKPIHFILLRSSKFCYCKTICTTSLTTTHKYNGVHWFYKVNMVFW